MIEIAVFLVFILALLAFFLSPAIYLTNKLSARLTFVDKYSTKFSIILAFVFSLCATIFIFKF